MCMYRAWVMWSSAIWILIVVANTVKLPERVERVPESKASKIHCSLVFVVEIHSCKYTNAHLLQDRKKLLYSSCTSMMFVCCCDCLMCRVCFKFSQFFNNFSCAETPALKLTFLSSSFFNYICGCLGFDSSLIYSQWNSYSSCCFC